MPFVEPFNSRPELSESQFRDYAARLGIDPDFLLAEPKSVQSLEKLSIAQQCAIPFENTRLHMKDDSLKLETPVEWMGGDGMPESFQEAFDIIVRQNRGAFCYPVQGLYSALLRYLGYNVVEMHTRTNTAYHSADTEWTLASHIVLFVPLRGRTYLVDIAFSAGCSVKPVPLDGEEVGSLSPTEYFFVKKEIMPGLEETNFAEAPEGWTLYRRFTDRQDDRTILTAAVYHVYPYMLAPIDIAGLIYCLNGKTGMSGKRPHQRRLICNVLLPNGDRRNLVYQNNDTKARYYLRSGMLGEIVEEEYVEPTHKEIHRLMRTRFHMFK